MSKNTNIYKTCLVYDQTHSFKSKYTQICTQLVRKVPFRKWYPCMLHKHFIDLHPIQLEKRKEKRNKYKLKKIMFAICICLNRS